jgi:hypothetical protein
MLNGGTHNDGDDHCSRSRNATLTMNETTLSPATGGICKRHSSLETIVDKVLLAMRPL